MMADACCCKLATVEPINAMAAKIDTIVYSEFIKCLMYAFYVSLPVNSTKRESSECLNQFQLFRE